MARSPSNDERIPGIGAQKEKLRDRGFWQKMAFRCWARRRGERILGAGVRVRESRGPLHLKILSQQENSDFQEARHGNKEPVLYQQKCEVLPNERIAFLSRL
jgi:hypothetical protein